MFLLPLQQWTRCTVPRSRVPGVSVSTSTDVGAGSLPHRPHLQFPWTTLRGGEQLEAGDGAGWREKWHAIASASDTKAIELEDAAARRTSEQLQRALAAHSEEVRKLRDSHMGDRGGDEAETVAGPGQCTEGRGGAVEGARGGRCKGLQMSQRPPSSRRCEEETARCCCHGGEVRGGAWRRRDGWRVCERRSGGSQLDAQKGFRGLDPGRGSRPGVRLLSAECRRLKRGLELAQETVQRVVRERERQDARRQLEEASSELMNASADRSLLNASFVTSLLDIRGGRVDGWSEHRDR